MEFGSRSPRKSFSSSLGSEDPVTLLSYYSSSSSFSRGNFLRSAPSASCIAAPPVLAKKSERFFKTLRRRSKSASRLYSSREEESGPQQSRRILEREPSSITYTANGERAKNPDKISKKDKVTLVGFSLSLSEDDEEEDEEEEEDLGGRNNGVLEEKARNISRFSTLKTSREVKMERDRLRQERLSKLTKETKDWFEKLKSEGNSLQRSIFDSHREGFFEEARERISSGIQGGKDSNANDVIGSFIREHHERFSALMASRRAAPSASSTFFNSNSLGRGGGGVEGKAYNGEKGNNKQFPSSPRVRHIPVVREFSPSSVEPPKEEEHLQRSSSSSSSSGFSSIGRPSRRDTTSSPPHHPSFQNHFGFNRFGNGFRSDFGNAGTGPSTFYPSLSSSPILPNSSSSSTTSNHLSGNSKRVPGPKIIGKISVSKTKTMENSASNFNRYSTSEEVTITSFGDSETESDDDDDDDDEEDEEDDDDLDSVSVVVSTSTTTSVGTSGSSTTLRSNNNGGKAPRPISAVPSEYSDVSTSSSRASEGEDDVLRNGEACSEETTTGRILNDNNNLSPTNNVINQNQLNNNNLNNSSLNNSNNNNNNNNNSLKIAENEAKLEKAHRIAKELLSTEEQYVRVLYLIDQVFHTRVDQENRTQNLFSQDVLPQMFSNIKSIYKFHAEFLLPQLRTRMDEWNLSNHRIGDIFVKFSPFFKMYTEYVKNFGSAIHIINNLYNKNSKFAGIMDEIHAMPECGNLTLQHHMLTPIQRIPRYELLLKDYLKKLPEDSDDREDSEKALHLVSTAAAHANDAMKRIEKFKKLLEVQESLSGAVDLVSPTRELVKEGKIIKISARSGDHQERYLFLFSDLLLLCSPRLITNRVISSGTAPYRLRARFEVDNIQVLEGDNLVTANSFYIRDNHKSVELYTQTLEEKEDWQEALYQTIKELYQRKSSLRVGRETLKPLDCEIGRKQPHLLKLDTINKCMDCGHPFSMMRKKHNCRACGIVICAKCSGQKFPLVFEENKPCRVCRSCFSLLTNSDLNSCDSSTSSSNSLTSSSTLNPYSKNGETANVPTRTKGLLEISPSESSIMSGYLQLKPFSSRGSNSKPLHRFFSLKNDGLLYSYKSESDDVALTATPMRNYSVYRGASELKGDSNVPDKDRTAKLVLETGSFVGRNASTSSTSSNSSSYSSSNNKKIYYLLTNSAANAERWAEALKAASRGDISMQADKVSLGSNDLQTSTFDEAE